MTGESTGEIRPMEIVTDLDNISVGIEELTALLQLYNEHLGDELNAVDINQPWTVAVLINRKDLGFALLHAIEDKVAGIKDLTASTAQKAYDLARSTKGSAPEVQ